jgi:hypothetical protein
MSNYKKISFILGTIIMSVIAGYLAFAWTEPTAAPPGANVSAPINVGTTTQHKAGEIGATRFVDTTNPSWFVSPAAPLSAALFGNVSIGTTTPGRKLAIVDPGVGFDRPALNNLAFFTGNVERMRIDAGGNVGIGTTTPLHRLHVLGKVRGDGLCIGADCRMDWPAMGVFRTRWESCSATTSPTGYVSCTVGCPPGWFRTGCSVHASGDLGWYGKVRGVLAVPHHGERCACNYMMPAGHPFLVRVVCYAYCARLE